MYSSILVLAPHTDDEVLGCGGTLASMAEKQAHVHIAVFSTAEETLPDGEPPGTLKHEFLVAAPRLGICPKNLTVYDYPVRRLSYHRQEVLEEMVKLKKLVDPDLVLLPSGHDLHQDHQVVYNEGLRAFKNISIMGYELPWNHITFTAHAFVALEERHLERKWDAMQAYRTQLKLNRPYFSRQFIESLAHVRGTQIGVEAAEAFEVIRLRM